MKGLLQRIRGFDATPPLFFHFAYIRIGIFLLLSCAAFLFSFLNEYQAKAASPISAKGTVAPLEKRELPPASEASLELMAGQMLMVGFRGLYAEGNSILEEICDCNLGGVILFERSLIGRRNISSKDQLRHLVEGLHAGSVYPLFVGIDQEGGKVRRLKWEYGFMPLPGAGELGEQSISSTELTAGRAAAEMQEIGINLDFAPVVDVNVNPNSPAIGALHRSFSADPELVVEYARAFLQGLQAHGVIGCIKHFPGHGSAENDTHLGLTDITATWLSEQELYPYRALIAEGAADMIMVGHLMHTNLDKDYPASLSHVVITDLLRRELGFAGVIISDDLQMGAITSQYELEETVHLAIEAGTDILLYGNNIRYDDKLAHKLQKAILELVAQGKISRARLEESYERIRNLKKKLGRPI